MADAHTVTAFDDELQEVSGLVAELGGLAEQQLEQSVAALTRGDIEAAESVIAGDKRVDQLQHTIEERAISLIARRQPMALDLREIVAAIRISNDLERVGDLAKNIGKRVLAVHGYIQPQKLMHGVEHMAELAEDQLRSILDAYAGRDLAVAKEVWRRDSEVDALYTSLFRELLTYMMEDPRNIAVCTHLLFCAKNIERIGDHATNIAETLHYLITGTQLTEERPKDDRANVTTVEFP